MPGFQSRFGSVFNLESKREMDMFIRVNGSANLCELEGNVYADVAQKSFLRKCILWKEELQCVRCVCRGICYSITQCGSKKPDK